MAIPEEQLSTWSHQGSIAQSSETYNIIKNVLESADSPFADKQFEVFLQGSYGNDTNIYSESDVDIVIRLKSCFWHDLTRLPDDQKAAFKATHPDAAYGFDHFKHDVLAHLIDNYGNGVKPGDKALFIPAGGRRRNADVIVSINYRRYRKFISTVDQAFTKGISFKNHAGKVIANYPKQHSENCTLKHKATAQWFKPVVRIMKNMRGRLVDDEAIEDGLAPSYFIEGLLYNVPNEHFGGSYQTTMVNSINWLVQADRTQFLCANEQYYLLREDSPVTWRAEKCEAFLAAAIKMWNEW